MLPWVRQLQTLFPSILEHSPVPFGGQLTWFLHFICNTAASGTRKISCNISLPMSAIAFSRTSTIYHHNVVLLTRIPRTLSCLPSLSSIAPSRYSMQHPISVQNCWRYVLAGHTILAGPREGVHRCIYQINSSLLLHQCPACLIRLTWIVFVMGGRLPYSGCLEGRCLQDLFNKAYSILVSLPSSFSSSRLISVHVVHPYSSIGTTAAWKKLRFILLFRADYHMIDSLSIAFASRMLISFSVDDSLLQR